jgi:YVTN family beta-propeller protein
MNNVAAFLITAFGMLNGYSVAAPVVQATLTLGNQATILCTDPVRAKAYATNFGDGTVSVIDLATLAVVATVPAGPSPRRALCNTATNRVYVVNTVNAGTVTVLDGNDHRVIATIPVGSQPRTIGADLSRDELYVSNGGSDTVSIVSTATHAVIGTVTVGTGPGFASASATLGKIYVPSATDGTVCVIDQSSRTVKTVKVGNGPQYAALDSQHGKVYVNNVTDRTMSVIDSATDTVVRTLPTGAGTSSNFAEVNGVYRRAYLPNASDGTLTIIDTETDTVVATLPVVVAGRCHHRCRRRNAYVVQQRQQLGLDHRRRDREVSAAMRWARARRARRVVRNVAGSQRQRLEPRHADDLVRRTPWWAPRSRRSSTTRRSTTTSTRRSGRDPPAAGRTVRRQLATDVRVLAGLDRAAGTPSGVPLLQHRSAPGAPLHTLCRRMRGTAGGGTGSSRAAPCIT